MDPKEKGTSIGKTLDPKRSSAKYHIGVLGKGLQVLRGSSAELRLTDIADEVRLSMSITFRMLHTPQGHGYVTRYKSTKRFRHAPGYRKYHVGYAQLSNEQPFVWRMTQGLVSAAVRDQVEPPVVDNKDSSEQALTNAKWLVEQKVDLVIEYEFHLGVGPALADMFRKAGTPFLAIDVAMPSVIYFGIGNYEVSRLGGQALAQFAVDRWEDLFNHVLLVELPETGPIPQARALGTDDGIRSVSSDVDDGDVLHKDGKGTEKGGYVIIH